MQWDKIVSIEYVDDYKYPYVYDFSVKDNESFTANDIIVHNTLNTFHQCGISAHSNINHGVPRMRELISISKKIKTPSLEIHLKTKDEAEIKKLAHSLTSVNLDFFISKTSIWYDPNLTQSFIKEDMDFMEDTYEFLDGIEDLKGLSPWVLRIEIDPLYLCNKNVSMFDIYVFLCVHCQKMEKKTSKVHIVYSDENAEHCVFHIRYIHKDIFATVPSPKNESPEEKEKKAYELPVTYKDYENLKQLETDLTSECLFQGIEDITQVIINSNNKEETFLETIGSNLQTILQHPMVDGPRTRSNDVTEQYHVLGIESAREVLLQEIFRVLSQTGVTVHPSHVELLVDTMTLNGGLISMNRYGKGKSDDGVMSCASFEEPDEHLAQAAVYNSVDKMKSTPANLTMGQTCLFGTGLPQVVFDHEAMKNCVTKPMFPPKSDKTTVINCMRG